LTSTKKQHSLGCLVLYTEEVTMKLNKHIIVTDKMINGKEILMNMWNMKNIVQF
jgi:hypothetical protein